MTNIRYAPRGSWVGRLGLYTGVSLLPVTQAGIRIISNHWHPASFWHRHHTWPASRCQAGGHQAYLALCAGDTRCQLTTGDDKRFEAWRKLNISIHPAPVSLGGCVRYAWNRIESNGRQVGIFLGSPVIQCIFMVKASLREGSTNFLDHAILCLDKRSPLLRRGTCVRGFTPLQNASQLKSC